MSAKQNGSLPSVKLSALSAFGNVTKPQHNNGHSAEIGKQTEHLHEDLNLPPVSSPRATVAQFPCQEANGIDNSPAQTWMKTDFNINAKHGGGTALLLMSRTKGLAEGWGDSEVQLIRCGFDGNHVEGTSLGLSSEHTIYHWHEINTDIEGNLCPAAMYGTSHCSILSNIASMGHCGCAVVIDAPISADGGDVSTTELGSQFKAFGGCLLVLCSTSSDKSTGNLYYVHQGESMELLVKSLQPGSPDLWQFKGHEDGRIEVNGPSLSHYSVMYSFTEQYTSQHTDKPMGKVYHTQAFDGATPTTLLKDCSKHVGRSALLMCSCSSGTENETTSALYQVIIQDSDVQVLFIGGSSGTFESPSVWNISICNDELVIVGPSLPCRYGVISNIPEDILDPTARCNQTGCLATGKEEPLTSGFEMRDGTIVGWVSHEVPVQIWINATMIETISKDQLMEQPDGRLGFRRELNDEESSPGFKLVRVYALQHNDNVTVPVEFDGSPMRLTVQPPGVAYAVNLGGPAYEALNHIVYADTQTTFTFDKEEGYQCQRIHSNFISMKENMYGIMANTNDGFLYSTCVKTNYDDEDKCTMTFEIPLPAGQYMLTIHTTGALVDQDVTINGIPYSSQISDAITNTRDVIPCLTARDATVAFTADGSTTTIRFDTVVSGSIDLCALTILDADKYHKPEQTTSELQKEAAETQKLSDQLVPLDRTFAPKEMKIVGWSSNLIQNSSGEAGDFSHWDVSGDWIINTFGGDQTETKFVSSHMDCVKYQEIDLSQHFSEAYLDSAPEIQACESFHEGCNHGGFYSFTVTLMNRDREVIETKSTGEKQIGIEQRDWIRESFTFTGYGEGVRLIGFKAVARDDKFWAGNFGAYASAALLRVKSEVAAAKGDAHADVVEDKLSKDGLHELSKIILDLNEEYADGLNNIQKTIVDSKPVRPTFDDRQESTTSTTSTRDTRIRRRKKREIRLFVSSTFVDFKDEREVLIKKVFRELNRMCLDRGVFFSYVDLRWGITAEQSKDGKTIFICLSEVDRCRPYFICLLGDRFGWNQTEENKDALLDKTYDYALNNLQGFEWLEEYRYETSVTKLEVLHAALRKDDVDQSRTFFYLREPRVQRDDLPTPQEKKRGESQWHFDQQKKVRSLVQEKGKHTRDYKTAEEAGAKIKKDLMACIDEDFPPGSQLSHIEQEREAHEAFADVRKRVYIGREEYFEAIDEHFRRAADEGDNEPLVIMGTSGSGKSALVANWCGRFEEKNPDDFLFMHFIGSSPESASHLNLLRRLYEELRAYLQQEDLVVPSTDRSLVLELPIWLKLASNRGNRVMLVLDALNQLDSGSGSSGEEHELKWLPKELPSNVHLLMSTLPGKAKDAVLEAGWPTMQVHPLNSSEKTEIITGYMKMYSKTLNDEQLKIIIDAVQSNNPLYLKALLDEVRMFGSYEKLTDAIKTYLLAKDPGELFVKILERLEADFENGAEARQGLVREVTTAIWCSHRGMSERELVHHLQIQSNIWSPFYLSLEENLVNRNGLVNFFHDYMRQAVERKYLASDEDKVRGHLTLANFFRGEDIDQRYVDEVPYLLAKAGEMDRLKATVLNIAVFQRLMETEGGKYQLIKSWQLLGGYDQVEEAYLGVLSRSDWETIGDKASLMRLMAGFFMQLGLLKGAKLLLDSLLTELEERHLKTDGVIVYHHGNNSFKLRCNHPDVIDVLIETGTVCRKLDLLSCAFDKFQDALSRQAKPNSPAAKLRYVKTLMGLGSVERRRGNAEQAKRFLTRALEVTTTVLGSNHHYDASIIGQIGELSYSQGVLGDSILHHLWDLKLTQNEVGLNHPRVAAILNNIALVLDDLNTTTAGDLFRAVLSILVEAYGKDHVDVAIVRYNLGVFFLADNFYQRARFQFDEALRIFTGFLGEEHPHTKTTITAIDKLRDLM